MYFPEDALCVAIGTEMKKRAAAAHRDKNTLKINFRVYTFESDTSWHGEQHYHTALRARGRSKCNCKAPPKKDTPKTFVCTIHFKDACIRKLTGTFEQ